MSWNEPFDASREFIVRQRDALIAGRRYLPGDEFDKSTVDQRVLARLYENRMISYPDQPHPTHKLDPLMAKREAKAEAKARKAKPSAEQLEAADALANAPGNTKKKLLELAEGLESVRPDMNKKAIALELIRAGRGPA